MRVPSALRALNGTALLGALVALGCSGTDTASSGGGQTTSSTSSAGGAGGSASTGGQASSGGQTSSGGAGGAGGFTGDPTCAIPPGASNLIHEGIPAPGLVCTRFPYPLASPRDVVEAADGTILVTEFGAGRIVALGDSGFTEVAKGLVSPIGLREDEDGSLLVTEEGLFSLARIDRATGARTPIAKLPHNVTYLATSGAKAYVSVFFELADTKKGGVYEVDLATGTFAPFATALNVPEGVFVEPDGSLFVAEWLLPSAVHHVPAAGGAAGPATQVATGFQNVYGLASDGKGGFYAGDHAGKITHVASDGSRQDLLTNIGRPGGIWIAASGDMWIAEFVDFGQTGYLIRLRGL